MIRCKLFGHKFVAKTVRDDFRDGGHWRTKTLKFTSYCVRCGAERTPVDWREREEAAA